MKTLRTQSESPALAESVAPEDLNCGDFIASLNVIQEWPSFLWCDDSSRIEPDEPVRIRFRASGGTPLKIKAICLPFVFVKLPNATTQTMDVRETQFVRLNEDYAKTVWNELKRKPSTK